MEKKMKNIIAIQHTQSVQHTNGMIGSWTDWDLTEKGKIQAENIGKKLSSEYEDKKFVMYSSPLKRSLQTAEIVSKYFDVEINFDDSLKERNLGLAVGKSVDWFRENMQRQEHTIDDRFFDDGESRRDLWNRLLPFYDKILNSKDENIIIVSHGDTLSVFNAMWLELDVEFLNTGNLHGSAGGVSFLHLKTDGKRTISGLSDTYYKR